MAIDAFNVDVQDVLDRLPGYDTSRVQQSSGPVSKDDISEYIDEGASKVAGKLERYGLDAADLDDEAEKLAQIAVRDYAAYRALADAGDFGDAFSETKSSYEDTLDDLRDRTDMDKPRSGVSSTIPSDADESSYEGEVWKA